MPDYHVPDHDPTPTDLAELALETPAILAGVDVVDAEIAYLLTGGNELAARRLDRARKREIAERIRFARRRSAAHTVPATTRLGQVIPLRRPRRAVTVAGGGAA